MSLANPTPRQAVFELIFAGALWGFGFVATQWALSTWNPVGVLFWRFAGALFLGEILYLIFARVKKSKDNWKDDFKGSIPAGLLLGTFLMLQTIGLQYTTASKSGFITTLYVIFVPIVNWMFFKRRLTLPMLAMVLSALVGTFFLMGTGLETFTGEINIGDLWTLGSAVIATAHIIYIGHFTKKMKNPFRVNNFQSLWSLIAVFPVAFWLPELQVGPINNKALWGIAIIAAACSVLAFYIQVRAQKVLSDTTASMLFLLESPYAFFFAYLLMGDRLTSGQSLGAVMILGAALGMVLLESGLTSKTQSK